ncbi:hypothetical protein GCM10027297_34090 [Parahaliea aestuarii]
MDTKIIERHLKRATDQAYYLGAFIGILAGFGLGYLVGAE